MRDYGKVTPSFWTGKTGRLLRKDPESQVVALYLMTSQHANMIGLYYCPVAYVVADTGVSEEGACKALQRLSEAQFCAYDWETEWVWVREMAKFQIADQLKPRDKQVFGVRNELSKIPNIRIKTDFIDRYRLAFHLESPENPSPLEGPSKPPRSQEQEQEQEHLKESTAIAVEADAASAPSPSAGSQPGLRIVKPPCPYSAIVALYHEILPELRGCKTLTETRKGYLRQRWAAKPGADLAKWRSFFEYIKTCPFLLGQSDGHQGRPPFVADLEWLVKPSNFAKIIEGKYEPGVGAAHHG